MNSSPSGFISDAVKTLRGSGGAIRDPLLPRLDKVQLKIRLQLDKALRAQELTVGVRVVEAKEFRP
jgi:hypothetical protein